MMLKAGIKQAIKRMSDHIDAYDDNAEYLILTCYGIDCRNHSDQVEIKGVPRERWPSLLARAAKGWSVDEPGEFMCPECNA